MRNELKKLLVMNRVNPGTSVLRCEFDEEVEMFALYRTNGDFVAHIYENEKRMFKRLVK